MQWDWGFLNFLAEPWFVIPWYGVSILGMFWVIYDINKKNTPLKAAMKWSWPIIVLFFSVIGLALYYGTARAPNIGRIEGHEARMEAHHKYQKNTFRRVNGAVVHCVAGDGLGIMTGMVIARAVNMTFWQEFWFEYLVGFLFGWFIFQFRSMLNMTDSKPMALAMAFRAEFFSMLTVMAGMGAVMGYVTPLAVTEQPDPLTYAFWGFGMLGLLVGYVFTFPMNWMMVKIGWKHGMGGMKDAPKAESRPARIGLVTAMVILGVAALAVPAWLAEIRDGTPVEGAALQLSEAEPDGLAVLGRGLEDTLDTAIRSLGEDRRTHAAHAIDAAHRAAEVGKEAAPDSALARALEDIKQARYELHMGRAAVARSKLAAARDRLREMEPPSAAAPASLARFKGASVLNANGVDVGEVVAVEGDRLQVALGGPRDVWGFWDFSYTETAEIRADAVVVGPQRTIGSSLLVMPTGETTPMAVARRIQEVEEDTPEPNR